jgi:hypothetical protein
VEEDTCGHTAAYQVDAPRVAELVERLCTLTLDGKLSWEGVEQLPGRFFDRDGGGVDGCWRTIKRSGLARYWVTCSHPTDGDARVVYFLRGTGGDSPHELTVTVTRGQGRMQTSRRIVHVLGDFPDLWNAVALVALAWAPEPYAEKKGGVMLAMDALGEP